VSARRERVTAARGGGPRTRRWPRRHGARGGRRRASRVARAVAPVARLVAGARGSVEAALWRAEVPPALAVAHIDTLSSPSRKAPEFSPLLPVSRFSKPARLRCRRLRGGRMGVPGGSADGSALRRPSPCAVQAARVADRRESVRLVESAGDQRLVALLRYLSLTLDTLLRRPRASRPRRVRRSGAGGFGLRALGAHRRGGRPGGEAAIRSRGRLAGQVALDETRSELAKAWRIR
jgi:hypothetical protein